MRCIVLLLGLQVLWVIASCQMESTVHDHDLSVHEAGLVRAQPEHLHRHLMSLVDLINEMTLTSQNLKEE